MPVREADKVRCRENVTSISERLDREESVLLSYTQFVIALIAHSNAGCL